MSKAFFLTAIGLLATIATAQPQPTPDTSGADKLGWQLAVHSYTFQKFTIFEAIEKTQAAGIKFMSVSGGLVLEGKARSITPSLQDKDMQAITQKLEACGIASRFVNMGVVQLPADETKSRPVFEFAKKWGINVLVSEPKPEAMDTVEKLCKEFNIKVAIHNHPGPKNQYWQPENVLEVIKGRSPLIGACADTGHWVRSGLDPVECLRKLDGHVIALHFKDLSAKDPKAQDVPWGTGVSNARGQMEEMKRQGFKGAFCVEYEANWETSAPEIAQCAKFFYATCNELAK